MFFYLRHLTTVFHPHGLQDVPKSILFGTETNTNKRINDSIKPFIKSYWAQCDLNYSRYFKDTKLFIIYGCSIGESDKWWWKKIYDRLSNNDAELIIYNYGSDEKDAVIDRFINSCGVSESDNENIRDNIYVINHGVKDTNEIVFLQLPNQ